MNKKQVSSLIASALLLNACGGTGSNDMTSNNGHINEPAVKKVLEVTFNELKDNNYYTVTSYTFKIGDRQFDMVNNKLVIDYGFLDEGLSQNDIYDERKEINDSGRNTKYKHSSKMTSYNQLYSLVLGDREIEKCKNGHSVDFCNDDFNIAGFLGQPTLMAQLPNQGSTTYNGILFIDSNERGLQKGDFKYSVDFASKTGRGYFTLDNQRTELAKANLMSQQSISDLHNGYIAYADEGLYAEGVQAMFKGATINPNQPEGHYVVALYGPNAEDVVGAAKISGGEWKYGLGGKRGDK